MIKILNTLFPQLIPVLGMHEVLQHHLLLEMNPEYRHVTWSAYFCLISPRHLRKCDSLMSKWLCYFALALYPPLLCFFPVGLPPLLPATKSVGSLVGGWVFFASAFLTISQKKPNYIPKLIISHLWRKLAQIFGMNKMLIAPKLYTFITLLF